MKTKIHSAMLLGLLALLSTLTSQLSTFAQSTGFTYQGRLNDGVNPANGRYDFQFQVFDAVSGGASYGSPNPNALTAVTVSNGVFTVTLDFGTGVFTGPDRWLQILTRTNGAASFISLSPRQKLTPTPYSLYAANAAQVGGQPSTAFVARTGDNMSGTLNLPVNGLTVGTDQLRVIGGRVMVYSATVPDLLNIESKATTGTWLQLYNATAGGNTWSLISSASGNAEGAGNLLFNNGSTRMMLNGSGQLGLGSTSPLGMLEIQGGADTDGLNDPHALAMAYRNGGFRHWISSRHNSAATGNAIDFYLNTNSASGGSSAPGTGNRKVMTLDSANGIKALGGLVIESRTGSDPTSPAIGQMWIRTDVP